jgi:hypothetical protein
MSFCKQMGTVQFTAELLKQLLQLPEDAILVGAEVKPNQVVHIHFTSQNCPSVTEGADLPFVDNQGQLHREEV